MPRKIFLLILVALITTACDPGNSKDRLIPITNKIQYDVYIDSPNPDYDWWINNLPGPQRDELVEWIFDMAYNGKLQAYDYFRQPLTTDQVKNVGIDTIYLSLMRETKPYDVYDTMVIHAFDRNDVNKVRFLEEWSFNEAKNAIFKEVVAIAPVLERFDAEGNFIANEPLFWLYFEPLKE